MTAEDRLTRLECHLSETLSGCHRVLRSINKPHEGKHMTDKPETVADVLAEIRAFPEAAQTRALQTWADRIERAMAASAVPVACIDARHLQLLRQGWNTGNTLKHPKDAGEGDVLLYAHAPPAVLATDDAKDAARFRWLRDHAINTEGRKGSPWCVYGLDLGDCTPTFGAELVAMVDEAMAHGIVCSPVPVESLGRDAPEDLTHFADGLGWVVRCCRATEYVSKLREGTKELTRSMATTPEPRT